MNGILSSAVSGLLTNTSVLNTVSNNVSNINTTGYVRREVHLSTASANGTVTGVEIADITRSVSNYLDQETLSATSSSAQYNVLNNSYQQLEASLGKVGDGNSLGSQLSNISTALSTLSQTPSATSSKDGVVAAMKAFANKVTTLYTQLGTMRNAVDAQVYTTVDSINTDIKTLVELNQQITYQSSLGNDTSGYCDKRDATLADLAQYIDIQSSTQVDGSTRVTTSDGATLVGDTYVTLSAENSQSDVTLSATYTATQTGKVTGTDSNFGRHISTGKISGLYEMHSNIDSLSAELGNLAKTVSNAYNSVSNQYSAYPPADTLSGRQTGLTDSEALNIAGTTTIAVTDASGNLITSGDIDFTGQSISGIVSSINGALSGYATASYDDGKLSITADNSANGLVIDSSANTGSTDFSSFFGLNDVFSTGVPSYATTGLSSSSAANLQADGSITVALKDSNGANVKTATVAVGASDSLGTVLTNLSNGLDNAVTFTMNSDGSISTTTKAAFRTCSLYTTADTTSRGTTGISLSQFLGVGTTAQSTPAAQFSLSSSLTADTLPTASVKLGDVGKPVVQSGDSTGALAYQKVETTPQTVAAAGNLSARTSSISDYANAIYQDIASRSSAASDNYDTQNDRLTEAKKLQSNSEGVNLDEELSNMVVYQQAYNASARLLTTYKDMYDTLLQLGQ